MDELEWLRRNAAAHAPSSETTQRHRTELRAAIAAESAEGSPSRPRPSRTRPPRHRVLLGVATVAAVCAAFAGVIALADRNDSPDDRVDVPAAAGTGPAGTVPACGTTLPARVNVPGGFGPPQATSAPEADATAGASQLVTTWTSPSASLEVRWPADADQRLPAGSSGSPDTGRTGEIAEFTTKRGDTGTTLLFPFPDQAKGCETVQLTVYGKDAAAARAVIDTLKQQPFVSTEPTVASTATADSLPTVVACPSEKGALTSVPVHDVSVSTPAAISPDPVTALTAFVGQSKFRLMPTGYDELRLPDGSYGYVKQTRAGVVTTLHVTAVGGGWAVTSREASSC